MPLPFLHFSPPPLLLLFLFPFTFPSIRPLQTTRPPSAVDICISIGWLKIYNYAAPVAKNKGEGGEEKKKLFHQAGHLFFGGEGRFAATLPRGSFVRDRRIYRSTLLPPSLWSQIFLIIEKRGILSRRSNYFLFFLISINSWSSIISAATMRAFNEKLKKVSFFCLCFILYRVLSCKGTGFLSNGLSK